MVYTDERRGIGILGETIAERHLEEQGYRVLERNYRTKYAEIDLIAQQGKELVFVEVRTRTGEQFGSPEETINARKKAKLSRNALSYVARKRWQGPVRIDAVCIVLNQQQKLERIAHYENIIQ